MRLPFRTALRSGLIPALVLSAAAQEPRRDGAETTQSPYFFVRSEDPATDQLPLKSTSAEVDIAGVIANVKVTQIYKNTGKHAIEAIYVFPGSTRAAVHALAMTVGDRVIHAQIKEKEQARKEYEQAKQEGRSASLLEQHRPNVFQMNVANILPGDEIKVELQYTELLEPIDGTYQFVYPTVAGPRYAGVPGTASATGEKWVASPYTPEGVLPDTAFDIAVRLTAGMPIQKMACGTHKTGITYEGPGTANVRLDPSESYGGNRDYILKYQLAGGAVQSGLLLHRGKTENFFLLMAQPPKRVAPEDMPAREYVFIMDVSGSQMGFPLEISKELMKEMIQGLRPQDRFNVMVFEGCSALWSEKGSLPATAANMKDALDFIRAQGGGGGTELGRAMKRALTLPRIPGISRTFVVSTDGYISADASIFDLIREHLGDANLFTFGIGTSVNRHLIEGMAHASQGEPFVLTNPQQAKSEAERFRKYVSTPVLSNVKLTTNGFQIYGVEPMQLPDVMAERPVIAFGKWQGEVKGTLTVSGMSGAGPWSQSFDPAQVAVDERNPALRQLWARKRIQLLSDYAQFGMTEERKKEITRLGLEYSLITQFTSFLAIDSVTRNAAGHSTTVTQPLPLPQGVSNSALPVSAPPSAATAMNASKVVSGGAQAVVEVVAAASDLGGGIVLRQAKFTARKPEEENALHLGLLQADRKEAPLARAANLLDQKLRALTKAGLMKRMPAFFTLELHVDGSGAVTAVAYDKPCGRAGRLLEIQLLGWRFEAWTITGTTTLRLPVKVSK